MVMFGPEQFQQADKLPEIMGKTHLAAPPEVYLDMYHTNKTFEEAVKETFAYEDVYEPEEELWATDEDAVEKAAYQKYIADQSTISIMAQNPGMSPVDAEIAAISSTAGMLTPWGPALEPLGVIDVLDEYPGAEYLGNVNSDETAETLGDTSSLLLNHLTQLEEAEELIQKNAEDTGGNLWDGVKQFGQAIAGLPLLPLGIEPAQIADIGAGIGDALGSLYDSVHNTHETIGDSLEMDALIQAKIGPEMMWGPGPSEESLGEFGAIQDKIYQREQNQTLDTMLQADGLDMMAAQISDPSLYKGDMASLTEEDVQTWLDSLSERDQIDPVMVDELETAFERAKMALRTPAEFGPEQFQTPPQPSVVATPQPGAEAFGMMDIPGSGMTEPKPPGLYNVPEYYPMGGIGGAPDMPSPPSGPQYPDEYPIGLPPITPSMAPLTMTDQAQVTGVPEAGVGPVGEVPPAITMGGEAGDDERALNLEAYLSMVGDPQRETFRSLVNQMPGSQRSEVQRDLNDIFSQTETLYQLYNPFRDRLEGLTADDFDTVRDSIEIHGDISELDETVVEGQPVGLGHKVAGLELGSFENWTKGHLSDAQTAKENRFGEKFYSGVNDLYTRMSAYYGDTPTSLADVASTAWLKSMQTGKETEGAFGDRGYDDLQMEYNAFMDPANKAAKNRLINLVAMYNTPHGADAYTRNTMNKNYSDMYDLWLTTGRTPTEFLGDFTQR